MNNNVYYYKVNNKGLPIVNSNRKSNKIPKSRNVITFTPQYKFCCDENSEQPNYVKTRLRYFIKLDSLNKPISGSLIQRKVKPNGNWQEIGLICCKQEPIVHNLSFIYDEEILNNNQEITVEENTEFSITVVLDPLSEDEPNFVITHSSPIDYSIEGNEIIFNTSGEDVIVITIEVTNLETNPEIFTFTINITP
jgi:hypothetical protein